ncbi:MAG: hypothetical protein JWM98_1658 [Thermoleophilia bacterium]|nr:hypothetical protein [Thermoleophilia bacterium]
MAIMRCTTCRGPVDTSKTWSCPTCVATRAPRRAGRTRGVAGLMLAAPVLMVLVVLALAFASTR